MSGRGPVFAPAVFTGQQETGGLLEHSPSVQRALFADGVPKTFIGRRYRADPHLSRLEREGRSFLRFGSSGLSDAVCVELPVGHVVVVIGAPGFHLQFVNTSIGQFTKTVEAVIGRFPFYDTDSDDEEIQAVGDELLEIIRSIDDAAAVPDRYWSAFVDDVQMGDLTTEAILEVTG